MKFNGIFLSLLIVVSVLAGAPGVVSAQSGDVTLTVSVTTTDGTAVGGATLTATWDDGSTTATTASNGKEFIDVPEGSNVTIEVAHEDYVRNSPVEVTDASAQDVDIEVAEKATATLRIEDDDGTVDNASVVLENDGTTVLDAETVDGTVASGTIEAGTYDLTVSKPGYYLLERELAVENDTERTIVIERGTVLLSVNITDDYYEPPRPVAGATVDIEQVGSIVTQSDGTQVVNAPVNSELDTVVSKDGYDTVERVITTDESAVEFSADLDRSAALTVTVMSDNIVVGEQVLVTVTDEYDDPVANADVFLGEESVATTGEDGTTIVTIESAGEQPITASKNDTTSAAVTVNGVATGETVTSTATTTTASAEPTTTTTPSGPAADLPDEYIPLIVVGILLIVVILGIRHWQQG
jgi:hypothetical protein